METGHFNNETTTEDNSIDNIHLILNNGIIGLHLLVTI